MSEPVPARSAESSAGAASPAAFTATLDQQPRIAVVGIGEDGWDGLGQQAQHVLTQADIVLGSERQLSLIAGYAAVTLPWPSPMTAAMQNLHTAHPGQRVAVLASGDPMFFGVGASLAARYGSEALDVYPHVSSASLACARLGWALAEIDVVSAVGRPLAAVAAVLQPGRRVLVLVSETDSATRLSELATANGVEVELTVLERLGGPHEAIRRVPEAERASLRHDPLAIIALDCAATTMPAYDGTARPIPLTTGIADDLWLSDGALTKREVRAVTLASLAPMPGQLLWDVGAGSGSIAIEWMRTHRSCRAVAIESREDRAAIIATNAERFGVPGLRIVLGRAPQALVDLPAPDVIFIGGGLTRDGVVDACLAALPVGGRLVANGVTIETEVALARWHSELGGELIRLAVAHADSLGSFTTFRPALPVTQWTYVKTTSS